MMKPSGITYKYNCDCICQHMEFSGEINLHLKYHLAWPVKQDNPQFS